VELQIFDKGPVTEPGCDGMLLPTDMQRATLDPQAAVAVTQTAGAPV
jgi:hypothetical protein